MATAKEPQNNLEIRARIEVAKTLMGVEGADDATLYKILTPGYGSEHAWSGKMYPDVDGGIRFIEGVGITANEALARRIVSEFPDYKLIEC